MNIFKFNIKKNHVLSLFISIIFFSIFLISNFINTLEVFASDSGNKQDIVSGVVPHRLWPKKL
jgi:hypothetical protein